MAENRESLLPDALADAEEGMFWLVAFVHGHLFVWYGGEFVDCDTELGREVEEMVDGPFAVGNPTSSRQGRMQFVLHWESCVGGHVG